MLRVQRHASNVHRSSWLLRCLADLATDPARAKTRVGRWRPTGRHERTLVHATFELFGSAGVYVCIVLTLTEQGAILSPSLSLRARSFSETSPPRTRPRPTLPWPCAGTSPRAAPATRPPCRRAGNTRRCQSGTAGTRCCPGPAQTNRRCRRRTPTGWWRRRTCRPDTARAARRRRRRKSAAGREAGRARRPDKTHRTGSTTGRRCTAQQ